MNSTEQLIDEICQIKNQYEAQVTGKHKQWPRAIKERICTVADSGMKLRVIAEKTGISYHTVVSWLHGPGKKAFREIAVVDTSRGSVTVTKKPVAVTAAKKSSAIADTKKSIAIKTPDGFLVHAPTVADVLLIIHGCRRGRK